MQQPTSSPLTTAQAQSVREMEKELNAMFNRLQEQFLRRTDNLMAEILTRHSRQFTLLLEQLLKQTFDGTSANPFERTQRGSFVPNALQNLSGLWQELQKSQRNL